MINKKEGASCITTHLHTQNNDFSDNNKAYWVYLNERAVNLHWFLMLFACKTPDENRIFAALLKKTASRLLWFPSVFLRHFYKDLQKKSNTSFENNTPAIIICGRGKTFCNALSYECLLMRLFPVHPFAYCNQKKFDKALPLLEEVIRRSEYHLEYSQAVECSNNTECI